MLDHYTLPGYSGCMTSTTVFRVAHSFFINPRSGTHFGPYATESIPEDYPNIDCSITDNHPSPYLDGLGDLRAYEVCGFVSLDAYFDWFDNKYDLDELRDCNFHLQVWEVPSHSVRFGDAQVAFVPTQGRIVDTMSL